MGNLAKFFESIGFSQYATIVLLISVFIDISPIKINPIKSICSFLGKWFNRSIEAEIVEFKMEMADKFNQLQQEQINQRKMLNKIVDDQNERELNFLCWSIIDFENSLLNYQKHSRDQYRHIIDDINRYNNLVKVTKGTSVDAGDRQREKEAEEFIIKHYNEGRDDIALLF